MSVPFLRSAYNYDMGEASVESGLRCLDASMAKQSFAEEVDINTIVKRFGLDGQVPVDVPAPTFADFDEVFDFHTAMNAIAKANEAFDAMPAKVRARFDNDPGKFVDFCSVEGNEDELRKLGLLPPVKVAAPAASEASAAAPAPSPSPEPAPAK